MTHTQFKNAEEVVQLASSLGILENTETKNGRSVPIFSSAIVSVNDTRTEYSSQRLFHLIHQVDVQSVMEYIDVGSFVSRIALCGSDCSLL